MSGENFRLDREIDAAKLLRASLADILADDPELAADMVLGETNLNEAIQGAVTRYCEDKCAAEAIAEHIKILQARQARLEKRMEMTRTLVGVALDQAGRKSVDTPLGTATLKSVPPKLIIDADREGDIPSKFWKRGDPKLDKKALKDAIKGGEKIDGARLDNGDSCVVFTFR